MLVGGVSLGWVNRVVEASLSASSVEGFVCVNYYWWAFTQKKRFLSNPIFVINEFRNIKCLVGEKPYPPPATLHNRVNHLNQEESLARRRKELLREVERRGFETIVLLNEVVNQNPGNFVYLCPDGIGDEHQSLVLGVNGDVTLVCPHWGAKAAEESGKYSKVVAVRQEKGHHMRGTQVALTGYNPDRVCFDLSTMSSQFAYALADTLHIKIDPKRDLSDHIFTMRSIKDDYEVSEMRRAVNITENAVYELIQGAIPGADTWKLKKRLDARLIELGALDHSFDSTLSFCRGPRRPLRRREAP